MPSTTRHGALFATFMISLIVPVAYALAAFGGWINWAAGLPVAVSAVFLAWTTANRINELSRAAR